MSERDEEREPGEGRSPDRRSDRRSPQGRRRQRDRNTGGGRKGETGRGGRQEPSGRSSRSYGGQRRDGGYRGGRDGGERREGGYRGGRDGGERREGGYRGGRDGGERREGGYRGRRDGGQRREDRYRGARPDRRASEGRDQGRPLDGERRPRRAPEPEVPEGVDTSQLDRAVWQELRTLSKDNAAGVAEHLVAAGLAMSEGDLDRALEHALTATRRAGRVASVREALGVVHYRRGEWSNALAEFRTARRLSGSNHLLPQMADVERGLGRPERALDLAAGPEAESLTRADRVELAIVVSGARRDMGQPDAAAATLRDLARTTRPSQPWAGRLFYAYADVLLELGRGEEAREWFAQAAAADDADETDAQDRLAELDGIAFTDLEEDAGEAIEVTPGPAESDGGPDADRDPGTTADGDGPGQEVVGASSATARAPEGEVQVEVEGDVGDEGGRG